MAGTKWRPHNREIAKPFQFHTGSSPRLSVLTAVGRLHTVCPTVHTHILDMVDTQSVHTLFYNLRTILIFCVPEPVKGNFISHCSVYESS